MRRGLRRLKPQSQQIDWNHPLARGLKFACILNEGAGRAVDLVSSTRATGVVQWTSTPKGIAFDANGSTELNFGHRADYNPPIDASVSMVVMANPASEAAIRSMLTKRQNGGSFAQISLVANGDGGGSTSAGSLGGYMRSSGTAYKFVGSAGAVDGNYHTFGCVWRTAPGIDSELYSDGKRLTATTTNSNGPWYTGTDNLNIGSGNGTQYFNDNILFAYYWPARALSLTEMAWLYDEPYAFIKPVFNRTFFAGGLALPITGTSMLTAAAATLASAGTIVNAYTGTSALAAAPATLAASGSISGRNPSKFLLMGVS